VIGFSPGPVIAVVTLADAARAESLGQALHAGGLGCVEITFRTPAAAEAIQILSAKADLMVGAGTVLNPAQVDAALAAGARFIVSPGFSPAVVERCREAGVPVVPGIATPTELMAAVDRGLDTVKFFPAEPLGGVAMLRALAAPFPAMRFIPTGGITPERLPAYLALRSVLAVGGSWMVDPALVAADDWAAVTRLSAQAVAIAGQVGHAAA
jgi:2-dehydro-3-deoxyphosphogluconate aldolase/(4S)-4-hydroxy-2-oxoglutarate aldolase